MGNVGAASITDTYHLQKVKLGEGSFGVVWRGVHRQTGEIVAVKQLSKAGMPARGVRRADVDREIKMVASLAHENIIRLYQTFEDSDYIYMALEYCEGGDFGDKVLERGLHIQEPEMSFWVHEMLSAITFMHMQRICHRDIKPDNFLVAQTAEGSKLKLADLGLACQCPSGRLLVDKCGTPAFMAPEQHDMPSRSRGYGLRVDVWAAGVCMYMLMLGGRHPFLNSRGQLDQRSLMSGRLDFRPCGLLGSLGIAAQRMSEDARSACQAMVCVGPKQRLKADDACARVHGLGLSRGSRKSTLTSASPSPLPDDAGSPGAHLPFPGLPSRPSKEDAGSPDAREASALPARPAEKAGSPRAGTQPPPRVGSADRRGKRFAEFRECIIAKVSPSLPSRRSRSADGGRPRCRDVGHLPDGPVWEFSVRDGYQPYQIESHEVLEEQYQAFQQGRGPPNGTVVSLGREVEVDFQAMEQRVRGGGRQRRVRRTQNARG